MTFKPTMKILYGPPGTGKTWRAAREAVAIVEPNTHQKWASGEINDNDILEVHDRLLRAGRIKWVTFHPSYTYEDFVEGFRPFLNDKGVIEFQVRSGPFRDICRIADGTGWSFDIGEKVGDRYKVKAVEPGGVWLEAPNNRKDAVTPMQIHHVGFDLIRFLQKAGVSPDDLRHAGTEDGYAKRTEVAKKTDLATTFLTNSSPHAALYEAILKKENNGLAPTTVVLVIDEINRADLSRVFGELITLLEPDKRIGAPEEKLVHLPYSGEERFGVPLTLSVIGTMNTADRSITSMDFAMRRRFSFEEIEPDPDLCPDNYGEVDVRAALRGINRRLAILRGRDFRLGHATFMEPSLENMRTSFGWPVDDIGRIQSLAYVFRSRVIPLLTEYFHEDWRKIEVALAVRGKTFGKLAQGFFSMDALGASDLTQFEEIFDTEGLALGQPAAWWNPTEIGFDAAAFAEAMAGMV